MQDVHIYTVSEITKDIRFILEDTFSEVWIEGEISNFKTYPSGHKYFSLKDENSVLNCVFFKGNSSRLAFEVEDGMHVLCQGKISVYDKRGGYQLYIKNIEPKGKGALQLAFEQLKEKLKKEGLFSEENKKALPFLPTKLGIVTSSAGAAIKDILKVVHRRYSNVEILIRPVRVQGTEAKHEIKQAIEEFNEYNDLIAKGKIKRNPIDVLIVGRGGGSLEDLWPFNEEIVARAIFASKIPIISAVGHEVDYTISDFVADMRAPTPSAAAEIVMPSKKELENFLEKTVERLYLAAKQKVYSDEQILRSLRESYILRTPMNIFLQMQQQIDDFIKVATSAIKHLLDSRKGDLANLAGKLQALSPLAVLERGYSITFQKGIIIKDASLIKKGDRLLTTLRKGKVESKVEKVEA